MTALKFYILPAIGLLNVTMVNPLRHLAQLNLKSALRRSLVVSVLSVVGVASGLTPQFQGNALIPSFSSAAYAQNITDSDIQNYARSILEIEPIRQDAYDRIKQLLGSGNVPPIACHRPRSLNNLNRDIREIAVQYCNQSIAIVQSHGLNISRFNAITTSVQADEALSERVQQELLRLQQPQSSARP